MNRCGEIITWVSLYLRRLLKITWLSHSWTSVWLCFDALLVLNVGDLLDCYTYSVPDPQFRWAVSKRITSGFHNSTIYIPWTRGVLLTLTLRPKGAALVLWQSTAAPINLKSTVGHMNSVRWTMLAYPCEDMLSNDTILFAVVHYKWDIWLFLDFKKLAILDQLQLLR